MQWVRAYDRKIEILDISAAPETHLVNSILKLWRASSMFVG